MTFLLGTLVAAGIAAPHLIRLDRGEPVVAASTWLAAVVLRALTVAFAVIYVVLFLPTTQAFGLVTHWCWHAVLPVVAAHLPFNGHDVADAASVAPALVVAASLVSVSWGVVRAARSIRRLVRGAALGSGPRGSVIVGGQAVMLGAAGLKRPRIVISAAALASLDDHELAAGLDHECAHIARRHRFILLIAEVCRAFARFLPGTRSAMEELSFHLERDADEWALRRRNQPLALASAICKAAERPRNRPAWAALSGNGSARRVAQLIERAERPAPRQPRRGPRALAVVLAALSLGLALLVPATVAAGLDRVQRDTSFHQCPH
jgi:Zn-dependent protease with chaperone function